LTGNGKEYHEGIICVDGSVIPAALGVNPLATITALAERSVEVVAARKGIKIDYETKNGLLNLFGPSAKSLALTPDLELAVKTIEQAKKEKTLGTGFTEVMEGHIYAGGDIQDFNVAAQVAKGNSSSARFFLSVHAWDLEQRKFYYTWTALLKMESALQFYDGLIIQRCSPGASPVVGSVETRS